MPGILLDLVQDLEGDFTASGSSRHDQVASLPRGMRQRLEQRMIQLPSTAPMIRQGRPSRKGGRMKPGGFCSTCDGRVDADQR